MVASWRGCSWPRELQDTSTLVSWGADRPFPAGKAPESTSVFWELADAKQNGEREEHTLRCLSGPMRAHVTQQPCFFQPSSQGERFSLLLGMTLGRLPANTVANTSAKEAACFFIYFQNILSVGECSLEHGASQILPPRLISQITPKNSMESASKNN